MYVTCRLRHGALLAVTAMLLLATSADGWGFLKDSLFREDPNVVDLESTALRHVHANANRCPWFVLFYDSMCGHCRSFAPQMSEFIALRLERQENAAKAGERGFIPVIFGAVNCAASPSTCTKMNVSTVPALYAAEPDFALRESHEADGRLESSAKVDMSIAWRHIVDRNNLKQEVAVVTEGVVMTPRELATCAALSDYLRHQKLLAIENDGMGGAGGSDSEADSTKQFKPITELYRQDVAGAFFLTMWYEVAMAAVSSDGLRALTAFLSAVHRSLPQLHANSILSDISNLRTASKLLESHADWKRLVESAGVPFVGNATHVEWMTCKGSSWKQRGLPCGLWSLYHAMLVNAPAGHAKDAMDAIQGYVGHFFVCYECRQHFASMRYDLDEQQDGGGKASSSSSDDAAVLWLWRAHNQVNSRLAVEKGSSDPMVPKVQWPTKSACPTCRDSAGFVESEVLKFLRHHYDWTRMREQAPSASHQPGDASGQDESNDVTTADGGARTPLQRARTVQSQSAASGGVGMLLALGSFIICAGVLVRRALRASRPGKLHVL